MEIAEINFLDIEEDNGYIEILRKVIKKCFEVEELIEKNLYINIVLTNPQNIKEMNKEYRNIDKETDVLSFPMFEKEELQERNTIIKDVLGDVVISIDRVKEQAIEYGHSFERELAYMIVHGFYHLMGYDHMEEEEKVLMRQKEEKVLGELKILKVEGE